MQSVSKAHGAALIRALGFLSGMLAAASSLAQARVDANWTGTVTVISQAGDACVQEPKPPYQRKVMASSALSSADGRLSGRLFISGDTEGMEAIGTGGSFALQALLGGADAPGTLALSLQNGLITGRWSEVASAREGVCSWTEARLDLAPAPVMRGVGEASEQARVEQVFRLAQGLMRPAGAPAPESALNVATMLRLGEGLAKSRLGNLALARLFLDQSDHARLFGQRQDALALLNMSSRLHRLLANEHPQAVAEALSREASAMRSMRHRAEAETLYQEALAVLAPNGKQQTATGSSVFNSLGALYLLMKRQDDAVSAFKQALKAQQQWGAPQLDVAGTLNNLAHALAKQGHKAAALAVFDEALSRLVGHTDREKSLAELIRASALALRGPDSQPLSWEG